MDIINPYIHGGESVAFDGFGNRSRSFDGVSDYVDLGDSDDFSFGDGSNDSPFSVSAWIKMRDDNKFRIFAKWNNLDPELGEWALTTDNGNRLILILKDTSTDANRNRRTNSTILPNYVGQWIHVVGTYDGRGGPNADQGIKLYVNDVRVDDNSNNVGQYTAMENTSIPVQIGSLSTTAEKDYAYGLIADVRLYSDELTAVEVSNLFNGTDVQTNLVGQWLTDEDNVLDNAGSNNGTNYGSKYSYDNPSPPVEFGSASRSFDGVNDYVDLNSTNPFNGKNQLTFSAWIKMDVVDFGFIAGSLAASNSASRFRVLIRDTGLIHVIWGDGSSFLVSTQDGAALQDGEWAHIAVTFNNSGNMTRYFNGIQTGTIDDLSSYGSLSVTEDMFIGARNRGTTDIYFNGNITDVRVYDTELTASQILDLYAGTNITTNLVGHWLTDNDDVEDKAGSNDGTNYGSTYSYDNPPMDLVPSRQASRSFDGFNDYVDLGDSDDFSFTDGSGNDQPFSLSVWVNMDTNNKFRVLHKSADLGGGAITNELFFGTIGSGSLCFLISGNSNWYGINTPTAIAQNEWVHISATYDGSGGASFRDGMHIYINGVAISHVDFGSAGYPQIANNIYPLWIGKYQNNDTYANGRIADVRIYDAELTASQILDIYNGTTDRTNLIGQWLTNSDDVLDHAGTNDGTNVGSTYSTGSPS